ncbi:MAG: hypothetical protein GX216_01105 [Methanomicrobiales archaeon]|nr:hypothetical protein [Methanomicrobiales archaeon]
MQRRLILLLLIVVAAIIASGCLAPEIPEGLRRPPSLYPTPAPVATETREAAPDHPVRHEIEFVDPQRYHIPTPTPTIPLSKPPDDVRVSERMVVYATATIDRPGRVVATETYHIPFPHWDLTVKMTPVGEEPRFEMDVGDARDPNRVIQAIRYSRNEILSGSKDSKEKKETFTIREGYGDYYFIIRSESIRSLTITIEIPEKYLV